MTRLSAWNKSAQICSSFVNLEKPSLPQLAGLLRGAPADKGMKTTDCVIKL